MKDNEMLIRNLQALREESIIKEATTTVAVLDEAIQVIQNIQ